MNLRLCDSATLFPRPPATARAARVRAAVVILMCLAPSAGSPANRVAESQSRTIPQHTHKQPLHAIAAHRTHCKERIP